MTTDQIIAFNISWIIFTSKRTEPSHSLDLKFNDFDLEPTIGCIDDFVQVFDGTEKRADRMLLNRTCGTQMPNNTLRSESNEMLVIMQSDVHIEAKGFVAEFETACGAKINTNSSGILEIGHNLRFSVEDCQWTIQAANPSKIKINKNPELTKKCHNFNSLLAFDFRSTRFVECDAHWKRAYFPNVCVQ